MKLEAIREDRTRGGRSTYQCSYTLPMLSPSLVDGTLLISNNRKKATNPHESASSPNAQGRQNIPTLLQVSNAVYRKRIALHPMKQIYERQRGKYQEKSNT